MDFCKKVLNSLIFAKGMFFFGSLQKGSDSGGFCKKRSDLQKGGNSWDFCKRGEMLGIS